MMEKTMTKALRFGWLGCMCMLVACGTDSETLADGTTTSDASFQVQSDAQAADPGDATQPGLEGGEGDDAASVDPEPAGRHTPECETADDCSGSDVVCSCLGQCVDVSGTNPCTEPKNCGSGSWCDPCVGHCQPQATLCQPCTSAGLCNVDGGCRSAEQAGCADQGVCIPFASGGSFCGMACLSSAGCPNGYECITVDGAAEKQCAPTSGECDALGLCETDVDCPEGEVCLEGPQVCGPGCTDDAACPNGNVCDKARCVPPCADDSECVLPALCDDGGHCKDPNACQTWTECPPEHYCQKSDGQCVPGCQLDEQCSDAAKVCDDGSCVAKGCEHNYQCGFEEECGKDVGDCGPMTRPHCSVCDASVDDPSQCGGEPNICASFEDAEGAAAGDFCLLTCDSDPIDACPQGYGCEHIEAPDAGIDGYYCVRQCWQEAY